MAHGLISKTFQVSTFHQVKKSLTAEQFHAKKKAQLSRGAYFSKSTSRLETIKTCFWEKGFASLLLARHIQIGMVVVLPNLRIRTDKGFVLYCWLATFLLSGVC